MEKASGTELVQIVPTGDQVYFIGDRIVERVDWMRPGISITRTYWDGDKLVTENVNPAEFYEEVPSNVGKPAL